MKLSTGWRADKTRKNRARATRKPKIRWEVLGLPGPIDTSQTTSMEDIRRQVSNMASRGFGQGTRSRTAERESKTTNHVPDSSSKRRRESHGVVVTIIVERLGPYKQQAMLRLNSSRDAKEGAIGRAGKTTIAKRDREKAKQDSAA